MFQSERERRIVDILKGSRIASPAQLQSSVGTSIATIRRDLNTMEDKGLITRHHGYVQLTKTPTAAYIPTNLEEKQRIAKAAAEQIHDGDILFLGSGTTCTCLAHCLKDKKDLTIMTINLNVVDELIKLDGVKLSLLGGEVRVETGYIETLDEYTINSLTRLYFDKVLITVDGIDFEYGYSIRKQLQLSLFQHLLENSKDFYCLADATKFNRRTYMQFCPFDAIKKIVTTRDVQKKYEHEFSKQGIQVVSG